MARDSEIYPELTPEIRTAMTGETHRLVAEVLASDGTLGDLLLADATYLNENLAAYYGLEAGSGEADEDGFRRVSTAGTGRIGLTTHGSFLTTHALPADSSPIHRGVIVRSQLLCQDLPPPPADLDTAPPPVDPNQSTRNRYLAHQDIPECYSCHSLIDDIGFAFEHFDGIGRWQEEDSGQAVDTSGEIRNSPHSDGSFDGVSTLMDLLTSHEDIDICYSRQWLRYGTGLDEDDLACSVEPLADAVVATNARLISPWEALLDRPHFWRRQGSSGELDAPAAGAPPLLGDDDDDDDDDDTGGGDDDDTPTQGSASVEVVVTSDWGSGYCVDVIVTNVGGSTLTWEIELSVDGTISSAWNVNYEATAGSGMRFWGVDWNGTIAPGGSAPFGYCANR